jgi:CubicO group peptidase (beta-lactamase class C family)
MARLLAVLISTALPLLLPEAFAATSVPKMLACGPSTAATETRSSDAEAVMRLAKDWIDTIRTADDDTYVRFVQERGPVLRDGPERWLELRDNLRGIQLCGVKSVDADGVLLWAFEPNFDSYALARFKPGKTTTDKVEFVYVMMTDEVPPGVEQPAKLTVPALVAAVEARAGEQTAEDRFAGAILMAQNGRILFEKAYGEADRQTHKLNTLDTQFRFGSMGKMFTAVAILQLVQDGKVALDAPIGRYLTGYPNHDIANKVTVANLLTHTGGTGDIFGPDFDQHKGSLRSTKDYVDLYGARAPEFTPGSRWSYSNYGFILLGRIVEAASGLSYDDYIRRHIFVPAGMSSTGNQPEGVVLPRRAVSYMVAGARLKPADATLPFNGTAAGGGYSTVGDFNRFVTGLTTHRLLNTATFQKLLDGGVTMADGKFTAFDFGGTVPGAGRFIGHGGGAPGMSGSLQHFLKSGVTIAVLANRDPGTAEGIALFAAHRLPAN